MTAATRLNRRSLKRHAAALWALAGEPFIFPARPQPQACAGGRIRGPCPHAIAPRPWEMARTASALPIVDPVPACLALQQGHFRPAEPHETRWRCNAYV